MGLATLNDVFIEQIEDLYSAETQLVDALPRVAASADDAKLRAALEEHLEQTRGHVRPSHADLQRRRHRFNGRAARARGWPACLPRARRS